MQSALIALVNTTIPSTLQGPKLDTLVRESRFDFNAMQIDTQWYPSDGSTGTWRNLNKSMVKQFDCMKAVIDLTFAKHHVAKSVAYSLLAETKSFWAQLFKTVVTDFYTELLAKPYGEGPYPKDTMESCWALVTKLLRTIFDELADVRIVACEAHLLEDETEINGVFLYAAMELRILKEFASRDFHRHHKFYPQVVMHRFNTALPKSMYEKKADKTASHTINVGQLERADEANDCKLQAITTCLDAMNSTMGNIRKACGVEVKPPRKAVQTNKKAGDGDDEY